MINETRKFAESEESAQNPKPRFPCL